MRWRDLELHAAATAKLSIGPTVKSRDKLASAGHHQVGCTDFMAG